MISHSLLPMLASVSLALCITARCVASVSASNAFIPPALQHPPSTDLDFEVEGALFHNKSLGLDRHFDVIGHQCSPGKPRIPEDSSVLYTPNRLWPTHPRESRAAMVVAIGGPLERFLKRMLTGWDGWREHLLSRIAHSTTLILLLDADQPGTIEDVVRDLKLVEVDCAMHKDACKKAAAIDSGYRIFIAPYSEANPKHNILVLISRTKFPAPWWLQRSNATEAEVISSRWKTKHCGQTSYLHTKSVNWYAFHMFRQLRVLDYFDFWMKMDDDVRWAGKFPGDITHHLTSKRRLFFHSGLQQETNLDCIGLWRKGPSKVVELYMDVESNRCQQLLDPAALNEHWFLNDTKVFASEFVGGWLGFWTSPEVLMYGLLWNNFPAAIWEYRWGDQQFYKTAIGLFDGGSSIEDVSYVQPPPLEGLVAQNNETRKHYLNILHHG